MKPSFQIFSAFKLPLLYLIGFLLTFISSMFTRRKSDLSQKPFRLTRRVLFNLAVLAPTLTGGFALANLPGGGTGIGPDVTTQSNSDGTITLDNGIATLVINPASGSIASLLYNHTQNGAVKQDYVIEPHSGGFYWGTYTGNGKYTHDLANDHLSPDHCDVVLRSDATGTKGIMEVHYSMLRDRPAFMLR